MNTAWRYHTAVVSSRGQVCQQFYFKVMNLSCRTVVVCLLRIIPFIKVTDIIWQYVFLLCPNVDKMRYCYDVPSEAMRIGPIELEFLLHRSDILNVYLP